MAQATRKRKGYQALTQAIREWWEFDDEAKGTSADWNKRPVIDKLLSPQKNNNGWWRLMWLKCTNKDMASLHSLGFQTAWHGCKFEALYSILDTISRTTPRERESWRQVHERAPRSISTLKKDRLEGRELHQFCGIVQRRGVLGIQVGNACRPRTASHTTRQTNENRSVDTKTRASQTRRILGVREEPTRKE